MKSPARNSSAVKKINVAERVADDAVNVALGGRTDNTLLATSAPVALWVTTGVIVTLSTGAEESEYVQGYWLADAAVA